MDKDEITLNNNYKKIKIIEGGEGGYGKVYKVKQINNNKIYALKESKKKNCQSFQREIYALNKISEYKKKQDKNYKSYTINMIDNFREKNKKGQEKIYIVLEYMPNGTLSEYFENNQKIFQEKYAKYLFSKIAKGVQEIHNSKLCHLDLKLENILLDENYNPIICDFGFSMDSSQKIERYFYSPGYAPKEIFEGKPYEGIKADIFSLGVVLFHIVTNKSIFYNKNKFIPEKNDNFDTYIDEDKYYKLIKEGKNDDYWKVVIGEELNLSVEFKDLVINMIAYNPEVRLTIDQIINHPWLEEINKLTEKEKIALDEEVKKELEDILKIKNENNKKKNYTKKNFLLKEKKIYHSKSPQTNQEIFTKDFELKNIDENNLDMKYYFKINGSLKPKIFMNLLYDKLSELKNNKDDDNRLFIIQPSEKDFKIFLKFENNNEEIIRKLEEKGIEEENYEDFLNSLDLAIGVKLYKAQNGYLVKVFKKKGTYEDFNFYLGKIMTLIREL